MKNKLHIVLINSSMACGGAERVTSILSKQWAAAESRVTVITIESKDRDHYVLDSRVERLSLDAAREARNVLQGSLNNIWRIRKLRNTLKELRPSVVISFQDKVNVLSLLAAAGLSIPVVICERNDPRMRPISPSWRRLRRVLYRWASALVVQTHSLQPWGESLVGAEKVYIVPNPVSSPGLSSGVEEHEDNTIVAAGRLVEQKGFDVLLQAVAQCKCQWSLKIIGDGPLRAQLENQAKQLGIADKVHFVGRVDDPNIIFRDASLFVLSSRYEGFPNVLVEAMACGLPAVSFDCASGPGEIVRQGVDGLLVPPGDASAMANAIDELMLMPERRMSLAKRAPEVVDRFSLDTVMSKWDSLISNVSRVRG